MSRVVDWREEPPGGCWEMVQNEMIEETIFPAGDYNKDRARMANALEIPYIEVRMRTVWMVWAPVDAENEWREDCCECVSADGLGHTFPEDAGKCTTTRPAEEVWDFWDETGRYCPWVTVKRGHPGAVKFRRVDI